MKKQMKRKTGLGITMVLVILMLGSVAEAFSGAGSGTEQDSYIITNVNQLQEMNDDLSDWYELGNDIDASETRYWNEDPENPGSYFGFVPIGVGGMSGNFTGNFDGKGHTISGLFVYRDTARAGLFGYVNSTGSELKNVGMIDVDITGIARVGGLVGDATCNISNSYSTGSVSGTSYADSYFVGGLIGATWQEGTITNCYSKASVSGTYAVGGFAGGSGSSISNSYSVGSVISTLHPSWDGGFLGGRSDGYSCNDCFWDIETSGQLTSICGTGKTTVEMKQEAMFTNWNFINIWDITEGLTYPNLNPRNFSGKGIWIWKLWETENGDVAEIIQRLNSVNVNWVTIKLGDGDRFWTTPDLTSEKINQFHNAGIKVFGWHFVHADDDYWGVPDVSEADVSNEILDIEGIDGLIINAEGEYKGKQDNAITYLENIRIEHPDSSIAYSTFARASSHEEFPYKEFGRYCDVAMPQAYWKDRPTTPTNEVAAMHSQWSELYRGWEGTENSSSIKPIIPMGQSYSDLHGYCSGSEIIEFCNALYDYGYEKASIYRYDTMTDETRDAYTISFSEVLIAVLSPVDLIVTDPDGLEISKELNEIPGATYLEYDINGDDELDDIVAIPKRKIGDYLTQIVPEPNVLPTDTYSLEATLEAATEDQIMVMAEDVQIQDIPEDPYEFESKLCYSDFDGDVDVDFVDYAIFASHWFDQNCNYPTWCEGTDLDYSGSVGFNDFAIFTEHWLWPNLGG